MKRLLSAFGNSPLCGRARKGRAGGAGENHRTVGVVALTFFLTACGFHPLYGRYGANPGASQIFSSIYVEPIAEDAGYELRNSLIDLLDASGRKTNPLYALKITVKEQLQGAALQNDATITRYNYTLTADYVLVDQRSSKVVTRGEVSSLSAWNVVASPYATLTAQHDAQRRGAEELAERIRLDLGVFFAKATGVSK
jgi:LPS-assembly lipoprotein